MEKKEKIIGYLQIITAVGFLIFWASFFLFDMIPPNAPSSYKDFENAFPIPDTLLCVILIISGIFRLKLTFKGILYSLPATGAMTFLGIVDMCYNFQNGIYKLSTGDLVLNFFINSWCILFGAYVTVYSINFTLRYIRKSFFNNIHQIDQISKKIDSKTKPA